MSSKNKIDQNTAIYKVVKQAGGQTALAGVLGVSQQVVSVWLSRGWVPVRRALEIEAQYGIHRHLLINPRLSDLIDVGDVE